MRKLFDDTRKKMASFLEQRDKAIMFLHAEGMQIAYLVKLLKEIEDAGSSDIFLIFPHDFESPRQFADLMVERINLSYQVAQDESGLPEGIDPHFTFPDVCLDQRQPPALRVREALLFARSLIPANQGKRLVCGILPLNITDPDPYLEFVMQVVASEKHAPWYRGMRIFIKQSHTSSLLKSAIQGHPYMTRKAFDLSAEAMADSLRQEAQSPDLPEEQRSQSLLQLAGIDYAHQRYDEAMEKYAQLLAYYRRTGNPALQAIVMTGIGDVHNRMEDLDPAREWYERALVPAGESANPIILFTVARNLGHIHYQQENYPQAETFFDGAQQLGLHTHDPDSKIISLEWRGLSQQKQDLHDKAADSFEGAAGLAREFDRPEHMERLYEHLSNTLHRLDQMERLARVRHELFIKPKEADDAAPRTPSGDPRSGYTRAADQPGPGASAGHRQRDADGVQPH